MIIKNNTNSIVEIKYYDRFCNAIPHVLCIRPHGSHEVRLEDGIILSNADIDAYERKGDISVVYDSLALISYESQDAEETTDSTISIEEDSTSLEESISVEATDVEDTESNTNSQSLVCTVCGRECASTRGLAIHMKSHDS